MVVACFSSVGTDCNMGVGGAAAEKQRAGEKVWKTQRQLRV